MSIFNKIRLTAPKSSTFNLSHERKFTLNMGELVPILCEDILPGDKWSVNTSQMLRMMPMIAPVMHEVNVFTHFFFVPNRLIWSDWEKFITGGEKGEDMPLTPRIKIGGQNETQGLADYMGLPTGVSMTNHPVSAMPFAAYQLIYNEYYRDQNLQDPVDFELESGITEASPFHPLLQKRKRAWQHDYFTSALPFAQKGNAVELPLGDIQYNPNQADIVYDVNTGEPIPVNSDLETRGDDGEGNLYAGDYDGTSGSYKASIDNSANLELGTTTINDLRRAFKLQEWLEKNARAGSRYVESVLAHFGVRSSDARLQRPEYLGGGMSPILISEVLQTSETDTTTPLGEMAGHGLNMNKNHSFTKYFEEHGQIIGIMSVMPKTAYHQGIPKKWLKEDKFEYFWPEFQHIGEQPIINKELYLTATGGENNDIFGYIPRYSEYRFINNTIHGDFRDSLEFWHLGRKFENRPNLNAEFIEADPSTRIFAVEDSKHGQLICQMWHSIKAQRKMSYYSDPSFR